jgi:hypothetical protein
MHCPTDAAGLVARDPVLLAGHAEHVSVCSEAEDQDDSCATNGTRHFFECPFGEDACLSGAFLSSL